MGEGTGKKARKKAHKKIPFATKTVSKKSWGFIPEDFILKAEEKKIIPLLLIEVNKVQQILTQIWLPWD